MNKLKSLTGKWEGEYTLGPEYESDEGKTFEFILDLIAENGTFVGKCIEREMSEQLVEPIIISGFWNEELISFTKQYPFSYYIDENGELVIDRTKEHPEIVYTGVYNSLSDCFSGDFEMVIESIPGSDCWIESVLTGKWLMKKMEIS
ncbi:MAG: hypothetical protein A2W93_12325 [Bacteroidetes bacterium GWF2_43_63]|nr:MAG: hypothetical protein A2W94_06990 [Bacteroidetes bacterium GWE2_42_42]OFY56453.1 MAG: hypothetical protein A2W93_12325 [Bacteroidetes bacterium GWF2_43_63]HBG71203.1 hypothetical protein [Bacteroidales bacterium]HCB61286.1 hypothetical protein [Bacteroidales bacterium]HCY23303.1 hypothetical protein [Bacteroidales bacterium]